MNRDISLFGWRPGLPKLDNLPLVDAPILMYAPKNHARGEELADHIVINEIPKHLYNDENNPLSEEIKELIDDISQMNNADSTEFASRDEFIADED